jgi:hypothetical protein
MRKRSGNGGGQAGRYGRPRLSVTVDRGALKAIEAGARLHGEPVLTHASRVLHRGLWLDPTTVAQLTALAAQRGESVEDVARVVIARGLAPLLRRQAAA